MGGWAFIVQRHQRAEADLVAVRPDGSGLRAYVAIEGRGAGIVEYADALRPGLAGFFSELRRFGVRRTLLLSGDDVAVILNALRTARRP